MGAAFNEQLVGIAQQARVLPHGKKSEFYALKAGEMGISMKTMHRKLGELTVRSPRKRRSDAGNMTLTFAEAQMISSVLMEATRRNNKRLMSIRQAMTMLISNGKITAERIDSETGAITTLTSSTVARALRQYRVHPDQLSAPAPVTELQSLHPNHVWEIDPSLCVLYYLRREADAYHGLQVMDAKEFYKNKPRNIARIEQDRVWRYVITDHTSGTVYVEYVLGAESGENLSNVFIHAIQLRDGSDPFCGVPFMAMVDPGSANTGAIFKNLCRSLQVHVQVNMPGNPRAKGQVEKMNDMVEKQFESGLKFVTVNSLDELNQAAWRWMRVFNGTAIHSRTKQTRYGVWMQITQEQLRLAPDEAMCRELAHSRQESRVVSPKLTVSYKGDDYDVSTLPEVIVGQKVMVVSNPWRPDVAQVVIADAHGFEAFHVVEKIERNEYGFREGAAIIGETYNRHADTPAQRNAKDVEMLTMGVTTQLDAAQARKVKTLAFNGTLDPYKPITDAVLPTYMPRQGTSNELVIRTEFPPLSLVEFAKSMGRDWQASFAAVVTQRYPDKRIPSGEVEALKTRLLRGESAPLVVVGGMK